MLGVAKEGTEGVAVTLNRNPCVPVLVAFARNRCINIGDGYLGEGPMVLPEALRDRAKTTSHLRLDGVVPLRKRFVAMDSEGRDLFGGRL